RLRERGFRVRAFETGTGVGGTWYWNRYPGARFDSESYSYGYSFSKELLEEWDWTELFSPQPETERYLNYVADKFDLRRDIQFSARVAAAHYDEAGSYWDITLDDGQCYRSRFLVTAVGPLSAPTMPNIDGVDDFKGEAYHTGLWPKENVSFEGKRVAVIGTGATGIQTIQEVAKTVGHMTVFQRRPNWTTPLQNRKIGKAEMQEIRENYDEIFRRCAESSSCFLHTPDPRKTFDVPEDERRAFWDQQFNAPGFAMWIGGFSDMLMDRAANDAVSEFVAEKIRERVDDRKVAEMLTPKDHGFGTRRVPQETLYYEAFNQPNVELVSILETPIKRITETGIETTDRTFEFDMIIYATGFDAITGSFDRIDIRGVEGESLKDKWRQALETFLGVHVAGFPNMFMVMGPHTALGNVPRSIEYNVDWVADLIGYLRDNEFTRAEARPEAVDEWTQFVFEKGEGNLANEIDSWMTGVNQNVAGKKKRIIARYGGTAPEYRNRADTVAANGYKELALS
ncbi:MAG: NAD(P)/FAD-dependent oxidoreductase, partial [Pseudomonadota bacterium]|nr:NAD(P)/FAD-dependent oxidoreductase [Pseudomonadota bacterium]